MKQTLLILISFLFIFVSCDKVFLEVDGKDANLQGKWQMASADTIFFNFQNNLFQYQQRNHQNDTTLSAYGYYTLHKDTAIYLELIKNQTVAHLEQQNWEAIRGTDGNNMLCKRFRVGKLNNKKLVLSADDETLTFSKF